MSSPRDASSAISSAVRVFLDVFGIHLLLILGHLPCGDQAIVLAFGVVSAFENYGAEVSAAPTDCTKLFGIVALLVNQVHLIEYFLCLFQADAVFSLNAPLYS